MLRIVCYILPLALFLSGCSKDEKESIFEITYTVDVNIQPGWNTSENHFLEFMGLPTQVQNQLDNRNISFEDIGRVETAYAELYVIFGDTNLDLLDEISIELFRTGNPDSEIEAAYLDPVPEDVRSRIQLIPSLADFKQHFNNETFGMLVNLRPRRIPSQEIECRLELRMAFLE